MEVLGNCLTNALRNSIGKSIVAHFDTELVNMMYKVDGDFCARSKREHILARVDEMPTVSPYKDKTNSSARQLES